MPKPNILRQVTDLQAQADRLITTGGNIPEIETFASYNNEVKNYLMTNIKDEFVLNYVRTIPILDIDSIETKSNLFIIFISLFFGSIGIAYSEKDKINKALKVVKEISNKYSSYEMMIENNLEE